MKRILSIAVVAFSLLSASAWAEMVNINKASAEQIQDNLKGVGEKKAEAIVAYRTEHGEFKTIEEIKEVKGIGNGIFEKIKADLSLDQGVGSLAGTQESVKTPESKAAAPVDKAVEEAASDKKEEQKAGKSDKKAAADAVDAGKKDKS